MVQTCRNINVHVVNTDMIYNKQMNVYRLHKKQICQCAQYKLKIVTKTWQQKHSGKHVLVKKRKSG